MKTVVVAIDSENNLLKTCKHDAMSVNWRKTVSLIIGGLVVASVALTAFQSDSEH